MRKRFEKRFEKKGRITILVGIGHLSIGELGGMGGLLKRVIKIFNDLFRCPVSSLPHNI